MIDFQLDDRSGVAAYLQLAQQVRHALRLGMLGPGDKLPTAKEVVAKLAINPNTVLKAYRELEREGLVGAQPGLGTFVLKTLTHHDLAERAEPQQQLAHWVPTPAARVWSMRTSTRCTTRVMRQDINHTEGLHDTRA